MKVLHIEVCQKKIIWGMRKRQTFEIKLEGTQDSLWLLRVGTLC